MIDYLYGPVQHDAFFKKYASKKFLKGVSIFKHGFAKLTRRSFNGRPRLGQATRPRISRWSPSITPIELEEQATMSVSPNSNFRPKHVYTLTHSFYECHPNISSLLIHRRFLVHGTKRVLICFLILPFLTILLVSTLAWTMFDRCVLQKVTMHIGVL